MGTPENIMNRFAAEISASRKSMGMSQKDFAGLLSTTQQTVGRWEKAKAFPWPKQWEPIRKVTGIDVAQIINDSLPRDTAIAKASEIVRTVPVISWRIAMNYSGAVEEGIIEGETVAAIGTGLMAFALRVTGDAMSPEFGEGDLIIVDPSVTPDSGSFVIADINDGAERPTFRQLIIDGGRFYLKSLNPAYLTIEAGKDLRVLGTVVQKNKLYR